MVLPPVSKTPVLLMRFTPKASQNAILAVIEALARGGIAVLESEGLYDEDGKIIGGRDYGGNSDDERTPVVLGLTTTQNLLEHEAELIRLVKPCRTSHKHIPTIMEPFSSGDARQDFIKIKHANMEDYDEDGLFTSAERAMLLDSMIIAIPAPSFFLLDAIGGKRTLVGDAYKKLTKSAVGSACQKFRSSIIKGKKDEDEESDSTLYQVLRQSGYIDVISPVHSPHIKRRILKDTYSIRTAPPLQAIRDYYGEAVAFYFAWMHHMTNWFVFPGLLGLTVYIWRFYSGDTVDTCELTPFVGLATFCWAVMCIRFWERREAELAHEWGTLTLTHGEKIKVEKRNSFRGTMRLSPITGSMEEFYPASKRMLKCVISAIITMFLLAAACVIMVISMNLQGYVSRADQKLWGDQEHPLYFPFFAKMAEEGGIFDINSAWKSLLPGILRSLVVVNINQQYSKVAEKLTKWENHETVMGHENSVILKRVLFEAFDAYIILFYLAIYERDIYLLRLELVGAFNVDTLRRVFTECVLPFILISFKKDHAGMSKKDDDLNKKRTAGHLNLEADLEEYDTFDDYIEMLIQFGYVTLFASAYPLAAFIAMGANLIEIRTDLWKLTYLFRRRTPVRANNIGVWTLSLKTIAWLSASSNLLIFAFTSSQMRQWFPAFYVTDEDTGRSRIEGSSMHEILLIVLVIEQCLILLAAFVKSAIASTPEAVSIEIQKRTWYHENLVFKARHRTMQMNSVQLKALSNVFKENSEQNLRSSMLRRASSSSIKLGESKKS